MTAVPGTALLTSPAEPTPLLRVVFSRDELRTRGPALPPEERLIGVRRVLMPIDTDAGGTWIAANDAGLVFTLLNVTRGSCGHDPPAALSRGLIIPSLAGCASLAEAVRGLHGLDPARYKPFRLVALSPDSVIDAIADGRELRVRHLPLARPRLRTSSSLGDEHVLVPRTILFRRAFARLPIAPARQDAFHRHRWPGRPHVSVLMSRADARTVSITTVEVFPGHVGMHYDAL